MGDWATRKQNNLIMQEASTAIYVALAVALAVWFALFLYLWRLDAQAQDLRRRLENQSNHEPLAAPVAKIRIQQQESKENFEK